MEQTDGKEKYPNPPETKISSPAIDSAKLKYPNPPETEIPGPATLREQWQFAIRQYSRWYSHAWGTAALAGLSFFALGWLIKGYNPISSPNPKDGDASSSSSFHEDQHPS